MCVPVCFSVLVNFASDIENFMCHSLWEVAYNMSFPAMNLFVSFYCFHSMKNNFIKTFD